MNNNFTFALPSNYEYDVKKFAKAVTTKKWAKQFSGKLAKYAGKFTTANNDHAWTVGAMLQAAYGVNIGKQVEELLKPEHIEKIKNNIIDVVYN